ncbi:DUF362 domain-containing protein [Candidatus Latescibacterota bacterium]
MEHRIFHDEVADLLRVPNDRRSFLRKLAAGTAGAAFSSLVSVDAPSAAKNIETYEAPKLDTVMSDVSFVTGSDRRDNVYKALKPFEEEIRRGIKGKRVLIKPNMVGRETILCATHPDAVRGVLDFLEPFHKGPVYIGESTGRRYRDMPGTIKHFHLYDYFSIKDEFDVRLVDLNAESSTVQWVVGKEGRPLDIRIIDTFLDPDNYIISVCRPKTHNCMVVTMNAKNMLFGAPHVDGIRHDKGRMHSAGYKNMHFNMFLLSQKVQPQLSVVDGVEGMEGNGPTAGTPVNHGVAFASTDFVAADSFGCLLMDVPFEDVGYLTYCTNAGIGQGDLEKIRIIGPDPTDYIKTYKLHDRYEAFMVWKK